MESLGNAVLTLDADQGPLNAALSAMDGTVLGRVSDMAAKIKGVMGGGLKAGAALGTGAVILGAAAAGKALYDIGAQFDDAYDKIRIGTGATGKELEGLKDDFRDVVSSVPTDFDTAAEAITEVNKRLGLTGQPLRDTTKQFLELSRLTGTDLKTNIESVSKAFVDWEVPVRKQSDVLDGFFRISQDSGASVSDLASSVQQFGSPLRQLGFSLEESAAMFATFEKAGVNTSTMVPGLKLALANLSDPTDDLSKKFRQLGIDAKAPDDQLRQVFDLLAGDGISNTEKMNLAMQVFGRRAGADMAEAVKQGRFEVSDMIDTFKNGKDTIRGAAADTNDLSENWQIFKNKVLVALEPIATAVFDAVNKGMIALLDAMETLSEKGPKAIADVKEALSPLISVLKVVWDATKDAIDGIVKAFKGGFEMIGGIVKIFAGLFHGDWDKMWDGIKSLVRGAWDAIKGIFQAMTAPLRDLAKRIFDGVKDVIDDALDRVKAIVSGAWDRIKDLISSAADRIKDILSAAWDAIKGAADAAWGRVKDLITAPIQAAKDVLVGVVDRIKDVLSSAWEGVKGAANAAWDRVKDLIISPIQAAMDFLSGIPGKMFDLGKKIMQGLWDGIKSLVGDVKSTISSAVDWITGKVNLLNNKVDEAFDAVNQVAQQVQNMDKLQGQLNSGKGGGGKNNKVGAPTLGTPVTPAMAGGLTTTAGARTPGPVMDLSKLGDLADSIDRLNASGTAQVVKALAGVVSEEQGYHQVGGRRRTAGDGRVTRHR